MVKGKFEKELKAQYKKELKEGIKELKKFSKGCDKIEVTISDIIKFYEIVPVVKRYYKLKKCKSDDSDYKGLITKTKLIKDKNTRNNLLELWETLHLNNCNDFDIIESIFDNRKFDKK